MVWRIYEFVLECMYVALLVRKLRKIFLSHVVFSSVFLFLFVLADIHLFSVSVSSTVSHVNACFWGRCDRGRIQLICSSGSIRTPSPFSGEGPYTRLCRIYLFMIFCNIAFDWLHCICLACLLLSKLQYYGGCLKKLWGHWRVLVRGSILGLGMMLTLQSYSASRKRIRKTGWEAVCGRNWFVDFRAFASDQTDQVSEAIRIPSFAIELPLLGVEGWLWVL